MLCITTLGVVAMCMGIDGIVFSGSIGGVSGIMTAIIGYYLGKKKAD